MSKRDDLTLVSVRLLPDQVAALDDLRRAEPDIPDRTSMMRRLLERATAARNSGKPAHREDANRQPAS